MHAAVLARSVMTVAGMETQAIVRHRITHSLGRHRNRSYARLCPGGLVMVVEGKWVFGDAYCSRPCSQGLVVSVSLAAKHEARRCIDAGMLVGLLTLAVGLGTGPHATMLSG